MLRLSRSTDDYEDDDVSVVSGLSGTLFHARDLGVSYTATNCTSGAATTTSAKEAEENIAEAQAVVPESLCLLFGVVSFGYMCAWTSLGSLISYYKHVYSPALYNNIYCAFYLFGLPIAALQYKYDTAVDHTWGSKRAYMFKGAFSFGLMILVLFLLPFVKSTTGLLFLYSILGGCTWLIHGTASLLVAVFPSRAIGYLQTGFRSPEIFTLLAVSVLKIGPDVNTSHLNLFYMSIAVMVSLGGLAWYHVVSSPITDSFFLDIDKANEELYWLDSNANLQIGRGQDDGDSVLSDHNSPHVHVRNGTRDDIDIEKEDHDNYDDDEEYGGGIFESSHLLREDSRSSDGNTGRSKRCIVSTTSFYGTPRRSYGSAAQFNHLAPASVSNRRNMSNDHDNNVSSHSKQKGVGEHSVSVESSVPIERNSGYQKFSKTEVLKAIRPLCLALFLVMFTSIFQASFFSYPNSTFPGTDLEQKLYFTRLFLDLTGRPLATLLPRPWFVKTPALVFKWSLWRLILFFLYFLYAFCPGFPQNDTFIVYVVGIFSLINGYFGVLIYEYASHETSHLGKNAQTYAANLLNIVFQISAFVSVSASFIITSYATRM